MPKINVSNVGADANLASVADDLHVRIDGMQVEVVFSCDTIGRTRFVRNVSMTGDSSYVGWTTPQTAEQDNRVFYDLDSTILWLTAGTQPRRDAFDDEVDYRGAVGEREGTFRAAEMVESGSFDPSEFATCMILRSHATCDWGFVSDESAMDRLEFWAANVAEMTEPWPDVPQAEVEAAHVIYGHLVNALEREFRAAA